MEKHPAPAPAPLYENSRTTPKDFFLWLGAIAALYGSITAFITLLFQYVNYAYPDMLAGYGDPYGGMVRGAMASVIVLVPTTLVLFRIIRKVNEKDPSKLHTWVRRWALVLTIFVASATILIDLITLITTFLGGEITIRFVLKAAVILLVAAGVFLHFLADLKGYWTVHGRRAGIVGIAVGVIALAAVIAGFFIIGSPATMRELRYDAQKVSDLQSMQYQIIYYWQQKEELPRALEALSDPLSGYAVTNDPQSGMPYEYEVSGPHSFTLCATFNQASRDMKGRGEYMGDSIAYPSGGYSGGYENETFVHEAGRTCFDRTIDPERYPVFSKPL